MRPAAILPLSLAMLAVLALLSHAAPDYGRNAEPYGDCEPYEYKITHQEPAAFAKDYCHGQHNGKVCVETSDSYMNQTVTTVGCGGTYCSQQSGTEKLAVADKEVNGGILRTGTQGSGTCSLPNDTKGIFVCPNGASITVNPAYDAPVVSTATNSPWSKNGVASAYFKSSIKNGCAVTASYVYTLNLVGDTLVVKCGVPAETKICGF